MHAHPPEFRVRLASTKNDMRAAQRLRYRVFVEELGGDGPMVDHKARLEQDQFDPICDHLILCDTANDDEVVGVYRLLRDDQARRAGQFYTEAEYDLSQLKSSGRKLLELGRSCLAPEYRGGAAMYHLWTGLAQYVARHSVDILFGVASFHGTDPERLAEPLSLLHQRHLAPDDLRVRVQPEHFQSMDLIAKDRLDVRAAMLQVPPLIKAYLRLGGYVGEGAYVDRAFNTIDVCLIMDTARMTQKYKTMYSKDVTT